MDFNAVIIGDSQSLMVRITDELADRARALIQRVRCLITTRYISCIKGKGHRRESEGLFSILPSNVSLLRRIGLEARDAFAAKYAEPQLQLEGTDNCFGFLVSEAE